LHDKALLLGDESHRNLDPMTQAAFGIGNFIHLSRPELTLLFELMKPVVGIPPNTPQTIHLQDLLRAPVTQKSFKQIQQILASTYSQDSEIVNFLTNKKAPEPSSSLRHTDEKQRHLILLTRYFLQALLPKILNMKTDFDHVFSQEQGETDSPAYHKTPSHAQFKDPYLTAALSIKGTWQRGLKVEQIQTLIAHLQQLDNEEQTLISPGTATPSQTRFDAWVKDTFPTLTLHAVNPKDTQTFQALVTHLKHHPQAVEYYLSLKVLSQTGYASEQFTSTPAHLMDLCKCSILFSATPLPRIAYPRSLQATLPDPLFEVRVLATAAQEKNQNFIFSLDMEEFFTHLKTEQQQLRHVRYLIDADGFLCHVANDEVARRWLNASLLDGVIYFKEGSKAEEENLCLLLRGKRVIEWRGTDHLKRALTAHRIDWESTAIGIFFDAPRAESANFPAIPHSAAYLLAGRSLTLSHAIQAIMRQRGFLDPNIDQTIIWVIPPNLKHTETFKSPTLFARLLHHEAKAIKSVVIMAAFQEIGFKIEKIGFNAIADPCQVIQTYVNGFKERVQPHAGWGAQEKPIAIDLLLWDFAKKLYSRFGYTTPFDEQIDLKKEIALIITQVQTLIQQVMANFHNRAVTEMHQKCILQEQLHQLHYSQPRPPLRPEPPQLYKNLYDPNYPQRTLQADYEVRTIFKTSQLTQNFYLEPNQLHTACTPVAQLKENFLKPIDFLLILVHQGETYAEALSHETLIHYLNTPQSPPQTPPPHKAFIIRADGVPYYSEIVGPLAPAQAKQEEILKSVWLLDVLIDVALLKGRIYHHARFFERVKQWPHFFEFWSRILKSLPHPKEHSLPALLSYLPRETHAGASSLTTAHLTQKSLNGEKK
jgi:hypothetical protein